MFAVIPCPTLLGSCIASTSLISSTERKSISQINLDKYIKNNTDYCSFPIIRIKRQQYLPNIQSTNLVSRKPVFILDIESFNPIVGKQLYLTRRWTFAPKNQKCLSCLYQIPQLSVSHFLCFIFASHFAM